MPRPTASIRAGHIAIGSDADIAIWDPTRQVATSQEILHHGPDYTPYEGLRVTASPVTNWCVVRSLSRNGTLVGRKGAGQHLARHPLQFASAGD